MDENLYNEMMFDAQEILADWGRSVTFLARKGETPPEWQKLTLMGNPSITETLETGGLDASTSFELKFLHNDRPSEWSPISDWQGRRVDVGGKEYRITAVMFRPLYPWAVVTIGEVLE